MKQTAFLIAFWIGVTAMAQNPIIRDQFTADPTARVFNGKIYLYPSHDIKPPEGQRQDWFCMEDYHVFSSEELIEWEDHGVIATQNNIPWVRPNSYAMWAPDCVCKDGKYYFYFPAAPKGEGQRGFAVGVGIADNPEGPFTFEEKPIEGVMGIDPCVLIDDDGKAYIYWSGMGLQGAPLKPNMTELADTGRVMKGLPEGFKEGPYVFKRNGYYYLTFPWVRNNTETLAYSMSKNPLGPWEFKGIIMAESPTSCWTNHHSITEYKGQWYLFYHHNDYSPHFDKNRAARIDRLFFNEDGTIQEVKPTLRGVGIKNALSRIDIDRYTDVAEESSLEFIDSLNTFLGWSVKLQEKGWVTFADVDFSQLRSDGYLIANVKADENTEITIREGNDKGKIIAKIPVVCITEGQFRRDYRGRWLTTTALLQHIPEGVADMYVECSGKSVCIDWIEFKNREMYFSDPNSATATPDENGFIRRWLLLDPIDKPNRSNTVFTDSYLKEQFNQTYFNNQMTTLPKPGEKVRAGNQTLEWHALDSERYNVKLFRFADINQKQTYGVLFWGVTIIECDEDIENIRLAAGSNGASSWWLNGKQVLMLSGDRRMVEDDGMSQRITLHKGQNILRCAVINGPGMSDFCVRFIDEEGKPVTNYVLKLK